MASVYLKRYPMLFKAVLPGTLAIACGDMLCQRLEGKEEICLERTARMAITGAVIVTPSAYYLGSKIERIVPKANTTFTTIAKAGLNAACSVVFIVGSFCGNNLLQGRGLEVLRAQLGERLLPTYASGLAYWTGANLLLFSGVVPQTVAATAAFSVLWNVRMSSALNKKTPEAEAALAREERSRRANAMRVTVGNLQKESSSSSSSGAKARDRQQQKSKLLQ